MKIFRYTNLAILATLLFAFTSSDIQCQEPTVSWARYLNRKLGFSLRYPAGMKLHYWPDGVSVLNPNYPPLDVFYVSNDAFPKGFSEHASTPGRFFRRLRRLRAGAVFENEGMLYRKVANTLVNGRSAVRVELSSKPLPPGPPCHDCGAWPPPIKLTQIIVSDGLRFWEIRVFTHSSHRPTSPAVLETFETILSTFRFL